jgi:hypothetical protein
VVIIRVRVRVRVRGRVHTVQERVASGHIHHLQHEHSEYVECGGEAHA